MLFFLRLVSAQVLDDLLFYFQDFCDHLDRSVARMQKVDISSLLFREKECLKGEDKLAVEGLGGVESFSY